MLWKDYEKERIAYFLFRYPCEELLLCFGVLCLLCVLIPLVVWKKYGRESVVDRLRTIYGLIKGFIGR